MHLPIFKKENRYRRQNISFGGMNLTQNFSDGELKDCSGISNECFPAISQRRKSSLEYEFSSISHLMWHGKECIVTDTAIYIENEKKAELVSGEKNIVWMGNKILIFPQKVYYDMDKEKLFSMEAKNVINGIQVTFTDNSISVNADLVMNVTDIEYSVLNKDQTVFKYTAVSNDGEAIQLIDASLVKAGELKNGDIFSEVSGSSYYRTVNNIEVQSDTGVLIVNEKNSLKKPFEEIFSDIRIGDYVEISGCAFTENNCVAKVLEKEKGKLIFKEGTFKNVVEASEITVKRNIPDFCCVCVYENRLWGCEKNTVYASALGDPFSFFVYENLSTDSFAVETEDAGNFTSCIVYSNSCLFFKENSCYKLYGNRPANFSLTKCFAGGISKNDARSLVAAGGKIFYRGNNGVYSYYGGLPECISYKLGNISMKNSIGGADDNHYYLSTETENGREEFVYDIRHGMWSKSGMKNILGYACRGADMYRLTDKGAEKVLGDADDECEWFVELCPFDEGYYKTKNYSRLHICAELFENAWINVEVSCDEENFRSIATRYGKKREYINIPCVLKSCHSMRIRISGKGKSIIEYIVREFSVN